MLKKILVSVILGLPLLVNANSLDYNLHTTSDNDGVKVTRHTVSFIKDQWGVAATNTNYDTPITSQSANGLLLISKFNQGNVAVDGELGISQINSKYYLLGDINSTYKINDRLSINGGIYGDLLDGTEALIKDISFRGVTAGAELDFETWGISSGVNRAYFSDGNHQTGYFVKSWTQIIPGLNTYIMIKERRNSQFDNPNYFSPKKYNRNGVGISFRQRIGVTLISGYIERSTIKVASSREPATAWKLEVDHSVFDSTRVILTTGRDFGSDSGFTYRYIDVRISYRF